MNIYESYCILIHKLGSWLQPRFILNRAYPEVYKESTPEEIEQYKQQVLADDKAMLRKKLDELLAGDIGYIQYEHYTKRVVEDSVSNVIYGPDFKRTVTPTIDVLLIEMGSELETWESVENETSTLS